MTEIDTSKTVSELEIDGTNIPLAVTSKLPQVADNTVISLTANDLDGATVIKENFLSACTSLVSIEIPSSVTSIRNSAFLGCGSLASITLPDSLTSIYNWVFEGCSSLTSITIPSRVRSIGLGVFQNCNNLTTMRIEATKPPMLMNTDAISTATTKIYIPAGTLSAYQSATNWSNYASLFEELPA